MGQAVRVEFASGEGQPCKTWVVYFHCGMAAGLTGDSAQDWLNLVAQAC